MLGLLIAFLAGIVTIATPCTLPILPILFGSSLGRSGAARPALIALGFVTSFTAVALSLSTITRVVEIDPNVLRDGAAAVLVIFGLLMIWPTPFEKLSLHLRGLFGFGREGRLGTNQSNFGGFVLGTTLGLVWTPCAGPVLASILTLIAISKNFAWVSLQLLAYATGAAIPMLAIAYGGQTITTRIRGLANFTPLLQQAFGIVVIGFAAATYLQYDTVILAWLGQFYPDLQTGL